MASLKELLYDLKRIEAHREKLTNKKIEKIYEQLIKELNGTVGNLYAKYADEDGRIYRHNLYDKRRYARFLEEIVDNVDNMSADLRKEILSLIDEVYEDVFRGTVKAVKSASDMAEIYDLLGDTLVRPEILKQTIDNSISKLTLPYVLNKHRAEIIYEIQQVLTLGLMNGDRYDQMAKKIADRVGVSQSKANNIVRTEFHRNIEAGQNDVAVEIDSALDGSGLVYVRIYRTMGDEKVRPQRGIGKRPNPKGANHVKMEGQVRKVGEPFTFPDGIKTMVIGSSGYAKHDCNCRCFAEYDLMTVEEYEKIKKNGGKLP